MTAWSSFFGDIYIRTALFYNSCECLELFCITLNVCKMAENLNRGLRFDNLKRIDDHVIYKICERSNEIKSVNENISKAGRVERL